MQVIIHQDFIMKPIGHCPSLSRSNTSYLYGRDRIQDCLLHDEATLCFLFLCNYWKNNLFLNIVNDSNN